VPGALGRIKLAALLATGFIALRLIYALIFSGLSGEQVLFSIPEVTPGGVFRHITFFGEVSWDGIQRNIELAIPFALSILVFGTLSALITPQLVRSASSRVKPLRNLLTALAISLSALPGVIAAAKEAGWARRVRGERPLAVIVPIFERMVQRATAVGLELSKADPKVLAGKTLRVSDFSLPGLGPINFDFEPGSVTLLSGETGSGKSTFLQAIAGELMEHHGRASLGSISLGDQAIDSLAASSFVAFVPQLPQQSFVAEKVSLELGAEVSNLNIMGTSRLLEKPTFDLSHGEAYRVALARAVARKPAVLLIDEPSAALDSSGVNQLIELVKKLSTSGAICIIADHRPQLLALPGAQLLEIAGGKLSAPVAKKLALPPLRRVVVGDEVVSKIDISSIGAPEELMGEISFELRQAQCVAITGANGSGKSTLLRRMAEPERGELFVHGVEVLGTDPKRVALVPDRPAQFFVTDSLMNELARADKIAGAQKGLTALTLRSILGKLPDENTHPLDLSIGTQLALSVAMQLSHKPQLLLLDEPVQGLDPESRELMAETIRCVQETGCAVVIATHDLEFANRLSTVVYEISAKRLRQASEVVA
jgi:energy-coupling factor transporter ATP-binding protein EcfA2